MDAMIKKPTHATLKSITHLSGCPWIFKRDRASEHPHILDCEGTKSCGGESKKNLVSRVLETYDKYRRREAAERGFRGSRAPNCPHDSWWLGAPSPRGTSLEAQVFFWSLQMHMNLVIFRAP